MTARLHSPYLGGMQHGQQFYRELASYYDQLFPVDPVAVDFVRRRVPGGRPVLDVACGTGGHVIALEDHGLDAYGIDNSPEMIEMAQKRQPHRFQKMDMRSLDSHEQAPFSLIYSIGNSLSHLPLLGDVARFLSATYNALAPDGVALFQIIDVSDLEVGTVLPLPTLEGAAVSMERSYSIDGSQEDGTLTIAFDAALRIAGESEPRHITQRLLGASPNTLRQLLRDVGFASVQITNGFRDTAFEQGKGRVAVLTAHR